MESGKPLREINRVLRVDACHDDVEDEGCFRGKGRERKGPKTMDSFSVAQFFWSKAWSEVTLARQARVRSYSRT